MRSYTTTAILAALVAPLLLSAAPIARRATDNEVLVLKFAEVLENLESKFYETAIAKFKESDFTAAGFNDFNVPVQQFKVIQGDEAAHATALQAALSAAGSSPVQGCNFNFDSALTDVATMAATARVVENLGVAAYLGAASLISDPVLLTAAGSILTVEARHQTVLNIMSGSSSAIPQAFDMAFTPSEVLAVASPFITGCDLGVPANPTLKVTNTGAVKAGTKLTFEATTLNSTTDGFHCQMLLGGAPFAIALPLDQCVVPDSVNGPVALWITSDAQPLANNVRDRATTKLVAGPTMAFVDLTAEAISNLARGGAAAPAPAPPTVTVTSSTETTTISPEQASSLTASPSATPTAPVNNVGSGVITALASMATGPSADGSVIVNGWKFS